MNSFRARIRAGLADLARDLETLPAPAARQKIEGFKAALDHWLEGQLDIAARRARQRRAERRQRVSETVQTAVATWATTLTPRQRWAVTWAEIREAVPLGSDADLAAALAAAGFRRARVERRGRQMRAWRPPSR